MEYKMWYSSPVGRLMLTSEGENLTGLWMDGQKYFGATVGDQLADGEAVPALRQTAEWLDRYFAGKKPAVSELPLAPRGGDFRQAVWQILCEIPYGSLTTYGEIARTLAARQGKKSLSAQAVGGAVGHNPISIIIPCHRVVGSTGSLTGYAGGLEKKISLLRLEGVDVERLKIPTRGTAL